VYGDLFSRYPFALITEIDQQENKVKKELALNYVPYYLGCGILVGYGYTSGNSGPVMEIITRQQSSCQHGHGAVVHGPREGFYTIADNAVWNTHLFN
jgi:hypothetical protein